MPENTATGIVTTKRIWAFLVTGAFCVMWSGGIMVSSSSLLTYFLFFYPKIYTVTMLVLACVIFVMVDKLEKTFGKSVYTPITPEPLADQSDNSASSGVQDLVKRRDDTVKEIHELNEKISGVKISVQIEQMEILTNQIISYVIEHPDKLPQIRRFMDYYLPTTIKLLNAYARIESSGMDGDTVGQTKVKIEEMMETLVGAFAKQMDALYADEAMDLATDITVMENMLKQEGLDSEASPLAADAKTPIILTTELGI